MFETDGDADDGLWEKMMAVDAAPLCAEDRSALANMYRCVVTGHEDWKECLDHCEHLLDAEISIEHTSNCSCGRFFEQHPTTIDDTEGEALERMIRQIETGSCICILNNDPDNNPLNMASKRACKSLLHAAAASGYGQTTEIVEYLLQKGCFVNRMTSLYFYTPMFRAVCSKNTAVVLVLINHKDIDVNLRSRAELHTPLLEAILIRHYPTINLLLSLPETNLDARNFRQETPIIVAARMGDITTLEQLLKMGADPDTRDHRGMTALMFTVMYSMKTVTRLLLSHGANFSLRNSVGETPLIMAISSDSAEVVRILLDAGVDVNEATDDGYPALMVAAYSNYPSCVRLLLARGADVGRANPMGYQALHVAAWNGFTDIVALLLGAGASADVRTSDQNTPLSLAAHGNFSTVVEMLLARECDVNNADKDLDTPLHYAAFNGNLPCMESLLRRGANPHALNRVGVTPLWNCVYRGHLAGARLLVKHNVDLGVASRGIEQHAQTEDVQLVYDEPRSPLWVASDRGHPDLAALLLAGGCPVGGEAWIGRGEFPGRSAQDEALQEVLTFYHSVPRSLMFQCRIALRRMAGSQVRRFVRLLPLPQKMRNFVLMNEMVE